MKKTLLIGLALLPFVLNGQKLPISSMKFIEESLSRTDGGKVELSEFDKMDFSGVWLKHQNAVIGYVGAGYQRLQIRLISVIKNRYAENEYFVYGKSKVRKNVCDFQGKFIVVHVREFDRYQRDVLYKEALKRGDLEAIERLKKIRGFVLAEYHLFENREQKGSGLFKGVVKSYFYIENGELFFDDLDMEIEDGYSNNQFLGIWKSYETGEERPCNWGAFRIPDAGDLDVGVGEFSPNFKYIKKGWEIYYRAYNKSEVETRKEEETEWWK